LIDWIILKSANRFLDNAGIDLIVNIIFSVFFAIYCIPVYIIFLRTKLRLQPTRQVGIKINLKSALFLFISTISFLSIYFCIDYYAPELLCFSFKKRLLILEEKINEQEYKRLKALWVKMKSNKDYQQINIRMDNLSKKYSVVLPEPFWQEDVINDFRPLPKPSPPV
jgi:hypothetical protein